MVVCKRVEVAVKVWNSLDTTVITPGSGVIVVVVIWVTGGSAEKLVMKEVT